MSPFLLKFSKKLQDDSLFQARLVFGIGSTTIIGTFVIYVVFVLTRG